MKEMVKLLGIHQTNTSAYHPQTDGLVERSNRTLTTMLAKTAKKGGCDWDTHLAYILFAYCASGQQSTQESPFFLFYGHDPRLPTEAALSPSKKTRQQMDLHEYGIYIANKLAEAWDLVQKNIKNSQRQQMTYDRHARPLTLQLEKEFSYSNQASKLEKIVS